MKYLLFLPISLVGCASTDYNAYLAAQSEANRQALEAQKPLIRITAQPGQQITGLASVEVYAPQQAPVIQQAKPNEWASVVGQALGVFGTVGGIVAAGNAAVNLSKSVGNAASVGYQHIQTPQANVTTSTNSSVNSSYNPISTSTSTTTLPTP